MNVVFTLLLFALTSVAVSGANAVRVRLRGGRQAAASASAATSLRLGRYVDVYK